MSEQENVFLSIKDDRLWKSIAADAFTAISLTVCVFVGWLLDSQALQWFGAVIWILTFMSMMSNLSKPRMTIEQARKELDRLENDNG